MKEAYPLAWPEGWPRSRIQDRRDNKQWKMSLTKIQELLMNACEEGYSHRESILRRRRKCRSNQVSSIIRRTGGQTQCGAVRLRPEDFGMK